LVGTAQRNPSRKSFSREKEESGTVLFAALTCTATAHKPSANKNSATADYARTDLQHFNQQRTTTYVVEIVFQMPMRRYFLALSELVPHANTN